jgi:hypothetical protein
MGTLPLMFESDWHTDWPQEWFTSPEVEAWSIHRLVRVLRRHLRKTSILTILNLYLRVVTYTRAYT